MFGEKHSESPRLPSPWLARTSNGSSPSPLSLSAADSASSTPPHAWQRRSFEGLELLDGLAEDFDSIGIGRGKLGSPVLPPGLAEPELEDIAVSNTGTEGLKPEVDHKGHIEYKLKLLPTSLHRMAKLRTQLKWRLIEGGGVAVYELGLLDDGTLVGLKQVDMEESLRTLGQMLAGLGGGRVQITRVVRLGGSARPASPASSDSSSTPSLSSSQSSAPSSATASMPPSHAPSPVPVLFPSFDVAADYDDLAFVALAAPPVIDPDTGDVSLFPPEPERGPVPYPRNRTAEEQAQLRRDKRDARRARREAAQAAATLAKAGGEESSLSPKPTSPIAIHPGNSSTISPRPRRTIHTEYPTPIKPRDKPPKPPKPPRRTAEARAEREIAKEKEQQQFVNGALETPFKPVLLKEGDEEVRFVVEAVVRKASRGDGRRGRRRSSHDDDFAMGLLNLDGDDDESSDVLASPDFDGSGDDSETVGDGDEGWSYLDFDLAQLSSSVKSSVATSSCK